jgi:SEC-C motif-containing protein
MMRFPEDKIKEVILHPDLEIRDRATSYFAKSYSHDVSIMAQVIKAVETYGRQDAYRLIGLSRDLPQTEESIVWVIDELNDDQSDSYENYTYNLSMVLVEADPALLLPKETSILESRHFRPDLRPAFTERLRMLSWDEATCWRNLEKFCEEGKDKQYTNEVNLGHAKRIVEALARYGESCEERVHALLGQRVEDYRQSPMMWMEPLVVRLAGQAHLDSTIPLLVTKLQEDGGDLLNEECSEALTRIGTPAVLNAVAEAFPRAEHHFRLFATEPLEYIHSDLAVDTCLRLLGQERDEMIQGNLAQALLSQFAPEGIEAARRLLLGRELDFEGRGLRDYLLETCTIMGEWFPEYDDWLAKAKAEKEEHRKRVEELEGDPTAMLLFALEKLTGKKAVDAPKTKPRLSPMPRLTLPRQPERKQKVGRNDPCPCGSGKKFKKCCGRC